MNILSTYTIQRKTATKTPDFKRKYSHREEKRRRLAYSVLSYLINQHLEEPQAIDYNHNEQYRQEAHAYNIARHYLFETDNPESIIRGLSPYVQEIRKAYKEVLAKQSKLF